MQNTKQSRSVASTQALASRAEAQTVQQQSLFTDHRPATLKQHQLAQTIAASPVVAAQLARNDRINQSQRAESSRVQAAGPTSNATAQRQAVVQCLRTVPAVNTTHITAGPNDTPATDTVAPVPAHTWEYEAEPPLVLLPVADRMAALRVIRGEYTSIGAGIAHGYLSSTWATNQANNNNPLLDTMYQRYVAQGYVAPHTAAAIAADTPANQLTRKRAQIVPLLGNPAMLDELRNQPTIPAVDPFRVRIKAYYGAGNHIANTVEFSEGQKGYISRVEDTPSNTNSRISDRPNFAGEFPKADAAPYGASTVGAAKAVAAAVGAQPGATPTFSNVHHTATNADVGTQIGNIAGPNRVDREAGIDAVTKVVAEGGRFQAVAALGTNLRNDSLFFAQYAGAGGGYRVMEFRELWKKWTRYFGGGYGVPDATIRTAITQGAGPRAGITHQAGAPAATGYNYDLDAGQPH